MTGCYCDDQQIGCDDRLLLWWPAHWVWWPAVTAMTSTLGVMTGCYCDDQNIGCDDRLLLWWPAHWVWWPAVTVKVAHCVWKRMLLWWSHIVCDGWLLLWWSHILCDDRLLWCRYSYRVWCLAVTVMSSNYLFQVIPIWNSLPSSLKNYTSKSTLKKIKATS